MKRFHAHIYFEEHEITSIKRLRDFAVTDCTLKVWQLFEHQVGPHARPMLEMHFDETSEAASLKWLSEHRGSFSVLIHEDSGDDVKDHLGARWFGNPLPIHFEFFDHVKFDPSLAIHTGSLLE
jgi:DOPA 4,5-dioxygenase